MSNHRINASTDLLWKQTSDAMATLLWKQYKQKYPNKLRSADYLFRLRVAHTLILRFFHVYYNRSNNLPTIASQEWLIRQVLNYYNTNYWPIVGISSG